MVNTKILPERGDFKKRNLMKTEFKTHQSYNPKDLKVPWSEKRKDPEKYGLTQKSMEKRTVPGQAVSIKELIQRQQNGRPQPTDQ